MEGTSKNSINDNIGKNENIISSPELIVKFKETLMGISEKISTLDSDFEKIKNGPNSLPFTEKGIEFLQYIIKVADGPFIRNSMDDLEQIVRQESEKEKFEKIRNLFPFMSHLREAQGIIWNIDENASSFLNSMEKVKSSNSEVSLIEGEDISRVVLFYKLTELLKDDVNEMSRILEENFNENI
jgi:hypothetical protein